jgi:hypothetical protein
MTQHNDNLVVWHGLHVEAPDEWEILQYSRRSDEGDLAWADRHEYRLQLFWRHAPQSPDLSRIMMDYRARLLEDGAKAVRMEKTQEWHGLIDDTTRGSSRFGRYLKTSERLVEAVFLWPDGRSREQEQAILSSIREEPTSSDGCRRWRAFGLDARVPSDLDLSACEVLPANAKWTFSDGQRARQSWHFERLGMLDQWLRDSPADWLAGKEPPNLSERRQQTLVAAGHTVTLVNGFVPALNFPKLGQRTNRFAAAAWVCPADGRLYHASRIVPARSEHQQPLAGHVLRCCGQCQSTDASMDMASNAEVAPVLDLQTQQNLQTVSNQSTAKVST